MGQAIVVLAGLEYKHITGYVARVHSTLGNHWHPKCINISMHNNNWSFKYIGNNMRNHIAERGIILVICIGIHATKLVVHRWTINEWHIELPIVNNFFLQGTNNEIIMYNVIGIDPWIQVA